MAPSVLPDASLRANSERGTSILTRMSVDHSWDNVPGGTGRRSRFLSPEQETQFRARHYFRLRFVRWALVGMSSLLHIVDTFTHDHDEFGALEGLRVALSALWLLASVGVQRYHEALPPLAALLGVGSFVLAAVIHVDEESGFDDGHISHFSFSLPVVLFTCGVLWPVALFVNAAVALVALAACLWVEASVVVTVHSALSVAAAAAAAHWWERDARRGFMYGFQLRQSHAAQVEKEMALQSFEMSRGFMGFALRQLRDPCNSVLVGLGGLQLAQTLPDDLRAVVAATKQSADEVVHVLDNVATTQRIQAGEFALQPDPLEPVALLERTREALRVRGVLSTHDGVAVEVHAPDSPLPVVEGDGPQLQRAFQELATHAVCRSPPGSVVRLEVRVLEHSDADRLVKLRFEAIDFGDEMRPEEQVHLFEYRAPSGADDFGLGLGMYVARHIVDAHGGSVGVRSMDADADEPGNRVYFDVPLAVLSGTAAPPRAVEHVLGERHILIVDDSKSARKLLGFVLSKCGWTHAAVADGDSALQLVERGEHFDLVIMDNELADDLSGIETTRTLRDMDFTKPIFGVTANYEQHIVDGFAAAGANDVLAKPVQLDTLLAACQGHLRRRPSTLSVSTARLTSSSSGQSTPGSGTPRSPRSPRVTALGAALLGGFTGGGSSPSPGGGSPARSPAPAAAEMRPASTTESQSAVSVEDLEAEVGSLLS